METKRLDEIGTILTGTTPDPSILSSDALDGIPFLTPSDFQHRSVHPVTERFLPNNLVEKFSSKLVPPGTTAVTCIGATIGKTTMMKSMSLTNQQINSVIPNAENDHRFIYYSILTVVDHLVEVAGGSATPILNKTAFSSIRIPVFPTSQQHDIAMVLGSLDDKIAANHVVVRLSEQLIDALIYEQISAGDFANIGDELFLHYGKGLPASKRLPGEVPVVGSGGVVGQHSSPLLEDSTIVVGRKGSIGALHWLKGPSFPIDTTFWVESKRLPIRVLFSLLKRVDFSGANTDSAVPGLNRTVAYEMPMPFISDESVSRVLEEVDALDALCSQKEQENIALANTRDELLPLLMNGKISVREAEQEATSAGADIPSEEIEA